MLLKILVIIIGWIINSRPLTITSLCIYKIHILSWCVYASYILLQPKKLKEMKCKFT